MNKDLVIYGTHGLGRELAMTVEMLDGWNHIGYFDDTIPVGTLISHRKLPTLNFDETIAKKDKPLYIVIAVADPYGKEKLFNKLAGYNHVFFPTIIAPSAIIASDAKIGAGCIISHYVTVGPNTTIGRGVLLNTKFAVGHDTVIGDYSTFLSSTNISGNVVIGKRCFFGDQAFVIEKKRIGNDVRVGAGSRVFTNVSDGWSVFGYPAVKIN
ncbi:MAG: NeuD/PglB/VioB family sugar acetyltransferase [Cloacibacillus sp.]